VEFDNVQPLSNGPRNRVLRAVRTADGRAVVLKMPRDLLPDADTLARYHHEKEILDVLEGHGSLRAVDLTWNGHRPVLVLEPYPGVPLAEWLRAPHPLSKTLPVAAALAEVHARGVMHRDLSPVNILVDPATLAVRIIDFGTAARFTGVPEPPVEVTGTLWYLAPELTGRLPRGGDPRSDLYALGAVLYELWTGAPPFSEEDPLALVHAHLARRPVPPVRMAPDLPQVLSDVVLRCLEKHPEDRYQSAGGVAQDLHRALHALEAGGPVAPFRLGQGDFDGTLRISGKLYGQDDLLGDLAAVAGPARRGARRLILVTGGEGSGKSAVLDEAARRLAGTEALVAQARCAPLAHSRPYGVVLDALATLLEDLLHLPDAALDLWRDAVAEALGRDADTLAHALPPLGLLLGSTRFPAASVARPAGGAAAIRRLLSALAAAGDGLVLPLDDIHEADADSIDLLRQALIDAPVSGLQVVATASPEGLAASPADVFAQAREEGLLQEHQIQPLGADAVAAWLADTFKTRPDGVRTFAGVLCAKTGGNPFFLHRAVGELARQGHVRADHQASRWTWDLEAARHLPVAQSVAVMLAAAVEDLPGADRALLADAAVLGSPFDVRVLAAMRGEERSDTAHRLSGLAAAGLVEALSGGVRYRFPHERVRSVAVRHLDPEVVGRRHLRTIDALDAALDAEERSEWVLDRADHWNAAAAELTPAQRQQAAVDNLQAVERCRALGQPRAMLAYAAAGIARIGADGWDAAYEVTWRLHQRFMRIARNLGHLDEALAASDEIVRHARIAEHALLAYDFRCVIHYFTGDREKAIADAREGLRPFGVTVPDSVTEEMVQEAYETLLGMV
jgi:tetratricopeptide (TPR) repeat protein